MWQRKKCKIAFLGLGVSNTPLYRLFRFHGIPVTVYLPPNVRSDAPPDIPVIPRFPTASELSGGILLRTPGTRIPDALCASYARARIPVTTEAGMFLSCSPVPVIGVTGSDGKTTTVSLVAAMLREKRRVFLGGNIGAPLMPALPAMFDGDVAVAELSSFQLFDADTPPTAAAVTNVTENHLDWHRDFAEYAASKKRILPKDRAFFPSETARTVLSADDGITSAWARERPNAILFSSRFTHDELALRFGERPTFTAEKGFVTFRFGDTVDRVMPVADFSLVGEHNIRNLLTATALVYGLVDNAAIHSAAREFRGVPHRMEKIAERNGVSFYDSSIDSSPSRTYATLRAFGTRSVVIAGGKPKGIPMTALAETFRLYAKAVILCGDTAGEISEILASDRAFLDAEIPVTVASDMEDAVQKAVCYAVPGDRVVLSPAATSFDRYHNYEERGRAFADAVFTVIKKQNNY